MYFIRLGVKYMLAIEKLGMIKFHAWTPRKMETFIYTLF